MKKHFLTLLAVLIGLISCIPSPAVSAKIVAGQRNLDAGCVLLAGSSIPVSLSGTIPVSAPVNWSASGGTIDKMSDSDVIVMYHAPVQPGKVTITAHIGTNGIPHLSELTCEITGLTPTSTPSAATGTAAPTSTAAIFATVTPSTTLTPVRPTSTVTITPTITIMPSPTASPTIAPVGNVVITEVMGSPCGGKVSLIFNQYIELYNTDSIPVDTFGWYLVSTNQIYEPQRIVSWQWRNPNIPVGRAVTDSTVIPPGGYGVILSPFYYAQPGDLPYDFPDGTIILTVEKGTRLSNNDTGIISSYAPLTSLFIFKGQWNNVEKLISSYGFSWVGSRPQIYQLADRLPLMVQQECKSVQRKHVYSLDMFESWEIVDGSPGSGPYGK